MPYGIHPAAGLSDDLEALDLNRGMADDADQLLVRPDVVFVWGNVEVADEDRLAVGLGTGEPALHFVEEGELVSELLVDRRVRLVASGRHIEVVDENVSVSVGDRRRCVAGIVLSAEAAVRGLREGPPRDDRDAVVALLAVHQNVTVAAALEGLPRESDPQGI